jgi:hypothetical protein
MEEKRRIANNNMKTEKMALPLWDSRECEDNI